MIRNRSFLSHRLVLAPLQCSTPATCPYSTSPQPHISQSQHRASSPTALKPHDIDPRWLTMTKKRVGRCMMFGLKPGQIQEAGEIVQQIARDWRDLIAGSEGYLTDATRRGLFRQSVAWGEMVCRIRTYV
ncbi:hypothetical protein BJX64DRAFT_88288 [Aspergillus heterothallicus]